MTGKRLGVSFRSNWPDAQDGHDFIVGTRLALAHSKTIRNSLTGAFTTACSSRERAW
jgi:hypothetical protein